MAAITPTTRERIKAYLEVFVESLVRKYKGRQVPVRESPEKYLASFSAKGQLKPFHSAIIPENILRIAEFERGFSTTLGTTFEECAKLIALDHHKEAHRGYDMMGKISLSAINEIDRQVAIFEHAADSKGNKPSLQSMIQSVLALRDVGQVELRTSRADLFVLANDGTKYFFEIKSPVPNKGQCLEVTERILRFHLITGAPRPQVQAYFAMAYNPYGSSRESYKWSMAKTYAPYEQAVIIGQEFWNIIGGPTAYLELLEIYHEVGREKSKYMIDALAFGF